MSRRGRIAFIDDEPDLCLAASDWLEASGFQVTCWTDPLRAAAELEPRAFDAVITDLRMPGLSGDRLLAALRQRDGDLPVVLMSAHADVPVAVAALREGAHDFIEKPYLAEELLAVLDRAVDWGRLRRDRAGLRAPQAGLRQIESQLIGRSPAMAQLRAAVQQLAELPLDLVILGVAGSGRERLARLVHALSRRARRPFVALDCAALPEAQLEAELFGYERGALPGSSAERASRFEYVSGGTIYLAGIEALSPALQMRLFRVLQDRMVLRLGGQQSRGVAVRLIASSGVDLRQAIAEGRFRPDLGFRLLAGALDLPALGARPGDVPLLYAAALAEAAARFRRPEPVVTPAEMAALKSRDWPGDLAELQAAAERQVLGLAPIPGGPGLGAGQPAAAGAGPDPGAGCGGSLAQKLAAYEAGLIAEALAAAGGHAGRAAAALGLPRRTLSEKIQRLGVRDRRPDGPSDGRMVGSAERAVDGPGAGPGRGRGGGAGG